LHLNYDVTINKKAVKAMHELGLSTKDIQRVGQCLDWPKNSVYDEVIRLKDA